MKNPITKTIMESLETFDENVNKLRRDLGPDIEGKQQTYLFGYKEQVGSELFTVPDWGHIKSHLLQSQIRLIEAAIEEMRKEKITCEESHGEYGWLCGSCKDVRAYNQALEDQISSLNETLEFIKKNL